MATSRLRIYLVVLVIVVAIGAVVYYSATTTTPTSTTTTTTSTSTTATTTTTEKQLKVAAIVIDPTVYSNSWPTANHEALLNLKEKYNLIYEYTEGVTTPDGERVGRSYAERGFDMIIYTSWYPDAVKAIARDYPNVAVIAVGGGTELSVMYPPPGTVPPNVGHTDTYLQGSAYLCGYLAGKMTQTGVLGIVDQYPVLNANRKINGFIQGARDANANVQIKLTWVYSWFDPVAAKEGAIALIESGADFIFGDAPGSWEGAEERHVWYMPIQYERPTLDIVPDIQIASSGWNPEPAYDAMISGVLAGDFKAMEYVYGMPEGGAQFKIHLPDEVPPNILSEVQGIQDRIMNRELVISQNDAIPEDYWKL